MSGTFPFIFPRDQYMSYYGRQIAERMFTMCTVYEFPKYFKMPKEMEERLESIANEYVETLTESLDYFVDDDTTEEDYEKIMALILTVLTEKLADAVSNI